MQNPGGVLTDIRLNQKWNAQIAIAQELQGALRPAPIGAPSLYESLPRLESLASQHGLSDQLAAMRRYREEVSSPAGLSPIMKRVLASGGTAPMESGHIFPLSALESSKQFHWSLEDQRLRHDQQHSPWSYRNTFASDPDTIASWFGFPDTPAAANEYDAWLVSTQQRTEQLGLASPARAKRILELCRMIRRYGQWALAAAKMHPVGRAIWIAYKVYDNIDTVRDFWHYANEAYDSGKLQQALDWLQDQLGHKGGRPPIGPWEPVQPGVVPLPPLPPTTRPPFSPNLYWGNPRSELPRFSAQLDDALLQQYVRPALSLG